MLFNLANELKKFSSAIDFVAEPECKKAIEAALIALRHSLKATIVEFRLLDQKEVEQTEDLKANKMYPCFKRYKWDATQNILENKIKKSDYYYLGNEKGVKKPDGVWTWVYEKQQPMWIEDLSSYNQEGNFDNMVGPVVEKENKKTFSTTCSVIIATFNHKIEHSKDLYGFLSIEFDVIHKFDLDEYKQLQEISNCLADLVWKSNAWKINVDGTADAAEKFIAFCKEVRGAEKTCLLVPFGPLSTKVEERIKECLSSSGIKCHTYQVDRVVQVDAAASVEGAQIAVVDITQHNPDALIILGRMINQGSPCLILSDNDDLHPPPTCLASSSEKGEETWLYYRYKHDENGNLCFVDNEKSWNEVLADYLRFAETKSVSFRAAN